MVVTTRRKWKQETTGTVTEAKKIMKEMRNRKTLNDIRKKRLGHEIKKDSEEEDVKEPIQVMCEVCKTQCLESELAKFSHVCGPHNVCRGVFFSVIFVYIYSFVYTVFQSQLP